MQHTSPFCQVNSKPLFQSRQARHVYEWIPPISSGPTVKPNGQHIFAAGIAPLQRLRDGIVYQHIRQVGSPPQWVVNYRAGINSGGSGQANSAFTLPSFRP